GDPQGSPTDAGAWCIPNFDFSNGGGFPIVEWFCQLGCEPGNNDCRAGYVCNPNPFWNDMSMSIKNCEPDCTLPSDCAAAGGCLTTQGCFDATKVPCDSTPDGGGTHVCKFM